MLIPLTHLNIYDYRILELAYRNDSIDYQMLKAQFPERQALYARINFLRSPDTHGLDYKKLTPSYDMEYYLITCNDKLFISEIGKKVVEDWLLEQKQLKAKIWEDRLYKISPIIISLTALIKSFWPEITCVWQALRTLWQV